MKGVGKMFNIIKTAIQKGGYKLSDIREKIQKMYVRGMLTEAEMAELLEMASSHVSAEGERPDVLAMLQSLSQRIEAIEKHLSGNASTEHEEWKPWDGISNKYQYGDIVSFEGKQWISVFNGQNVWQPGAAGTEAMWAEYHE